MLNPTPEQTEEGERLNRVTLELLSMDSRTFTRQDHIDTAIELAAVLNNGVALAVQIAGEEELNSLSDNFMATSVQRAIDNHLRIAEALR
jgi:hypothetical protein